MKVNKTNDEIRHKLFSNVKEILEKWNNKLNGKIGDIGAAPTWERSGDCYEALYLIWEWKNYSYLPAQCLSSAVEYRF